MMTESKIILSKQYLKEYVLQFEKRYSETVFERQEYSGMGQLDLRMSEEK